MKRDDVIWSEATKMARKAGRSREMELAACANRYRRALTDVDRLIVKWLAADQPRPKFPASVRQTIQRALEAKS